MSNNEEKKRRPNANYRLSPKNTNEDEIVYHYNRERRLEKAPQAVRDLYKDEKAPRFSLFRSLTNTKGKAALFVSIMVMSIFIIMLSIMGYIGGDSELEGNVIEAEAFEYEGAILVSIRKTIKRNRIGGLTQAYTGNVDIVVSDSKTDFPLRVDFTPQPVQSFEFTVPLNNEELSVYLKTEGNNLRLTVKPE